MWTGTHKKDLKHHSEKFDYGNGNLLTRGQTVENVPLNETEPVILNVGQMSLHHPKIVHGSGVNKSKERRMGFVIQSYIGSNVCLLYTSPSPRDLSTSRMPSSA